MHSHLTRRSAVFAGADAAGREQERRGVKADRLLGAASVHSEGHRRTACGVEKALEAARAASSFKPRRPRCNHCPATAEALPEIVDAVGGKMTILVDGAIRSGMDMFKALALGADALIGLPASVTTVYGGGEEGVQLYVQKLKTSLPT